MIREYKNDLKVNLCLPDIRIGILYNFALRVNVKFLPGALKPLAKTR